MKPSIICVDGPSGAGKGTLARKLAHELGFDYLDSGALYRMIAVFALRAGISNADDAASLAVLLKSVETKKIQFKDENVIVDGEDITQQLRSEITASTASKFAAKPLVRQALLEKQRSFANGHGLVADGRDMGTVVFPSSSLKIYLSATALVRAQRRLAQLKNLDAIDLKTLSLKDDGDSVHALVKVIEARDKQDAERQESPLIPASDAIQIDCTSETADEVLNKVLNLWNKTS